MCSMCLKQTEIYLLKKIIKVFRIGTAVVMFLSYVSVINIYKILIDTICFRLEMFGFTEVKFLGDGNCQVLQFINLHKHTHFIL